MDALEILVALVHLRKRGRPEQRGCHVSDDNATRSTLFPLKCRRLTYDQVEKGTSFALSEDAF